MKEKTVFLDLTEQEVRRLEQVLRGAPEYGPDNLGETTSA